MLPPLPVPRVQVLTHTLTFKPVQPPRLPPDAGLASPHHLELSPVRSQPCARQAADAEAAGRTGGHEWAAVFAGALPIRRRHPEETGRGPAPQTGSGLLGRKPRPARVTSLKATQPRGWCLSVFGALGASGAAGCQSQRRGLASELPFLFLRESLAPITFGLLCNGVWAQTQEGVNTYLLVAAEAAVLSPRLASLTSGARKKEGTQRCGEGHARARV